MTISRFSQSLLLVATVLVSGQFVGLAAPPVQSLASLTQHFVWPVASEVGLNGTFAELRSGHFHGGIDIKTAGRINIPVLAADHGWVFRISRSSSGYGNALFIRHANGLITVYGHLEKFAPQLEAALLASQLQSHKFNAEVYPTPFEYPVNRGQVIALSGNTGASGGPHLHFEIRDSRNRLLNPLVVYKHLIHDTLAPRLQQVAFQPLTAASRVNGVFAKRVVWPKKDGQNHWKLPEIIQTTGPVGFEFSGIDPVDKGSQNNGCYAARLFLDGQPVYSYQLDEITYGDSKFLKVHCDVGWQLRHGTWLQRCYILPHNKLGIYQNVNRNGMIQLTDTSVHTLTFELSDLHGNTTHLTAYLRAAAEPGKETVRYAKKSLSTSLMPQLSFWENVAIIQTPLLSREDSVILLWSDKTSTILEPAYTTQGKTTTYLLDLTTETRLPHSVSCSRWKQPLNFDFVQHIVPGQASRFYLTNGVEVHIPPNATYEKAWLRYTYQSSTLPESCTEEHTVWLGHIPLRKPFTLRLGADSSGITPCANPGEHFTVGCIKRTGGWLVPLEPSTRNRYITVEAGVFEAVTDRTPPTLSTSFKPYTVLKHKHQVLVFTPTDNLTGISNEHLMFRIDGQWIPADYSIHRGTIKVKLPDLTSGVHVLTAEVADHAGNISSIQLPFSAR
jgi:hypothetical protein